MQITSNKVLFLVKDEDIVQDKFEAVRMFLAFIYDQHSTVRPVISSLSLLPKLLTMDKDTTSMINLKQLSTVRQVSFISLLALQAINHEQGYN